MNIFIIERNYYLDIKKDLCIDFNIKSITLKLQLLISFIHINCGFENISYPYLANLCEWVKKLKMKELRNLIVIVWDDSILLLFPAVNNFIYL